MKNKKTYIISLLVVAFIILGFVKNVYYYEILAFFICCLNFLFIDNKERIYILFFLLPFATIFKLSPDTTSLFTILELFIVVLCFFKDKKKVDKNFLLSFILLFVFLIIVDFLKLQIIFINYLRLFVDMFTLYFLSKEYIQEENKNYFIKNVILFFSIGLILSSIVAYFSKYIPAFTLYIRQIGYNQKITNRFTGLNGDPNYYTIDLMLALLGLFLLYSKKQIKISFWILFYTILYFGLQTYSKSFFLVFIISLILLLILLIKNKNKKGLILYSAFILIALYILYNREIENITLIISRFKDASDFNSLTTGRSNLWISYLKNIFSTISNTFLGNGFCSNPLSIGGPHNWYVEILYYFGIIGSFLYIRCIIIPFSYIRKISNNKQIIGYLYFMVLIILYFFLQMVFYNETVFQLFIIYIMYNHASKSNNTVQNKRKQDK